MKVYEYRIVYSSQIESESWINKYAKEGFKIISAVPLCNKWTREVVWTLEREAMPSTPYRD